jgi:hypothetical protein
MGEGDAVCASDATDDRPYLLGYLSRWKGEP